MSLLVQETKIVSTSLEDIVHHIQLNVEIMFVDVILDVLRIIIVFLVIVVSML
ncbi:MAG: hypothetical protein RMI45_06330 [Ignisphaera sp.]|nr:hypothetical protein [Ignisphaera sp.]MDW8085840.1 hypothetical protein [Ignisphaera sp.]